MSAPVQPTTMSQIQLRDLAQRQQVTLDLIHTKIRSMDRGVGYRVSGDHSTWGSYHEGKSDFAGELDEIIEKPEEAVSTALNKAADAVLDVVGRDEERIVDVVNLVVNASLHFLNQPQGDLSTAIEDNYDENPDEVLSWIAD